MSQEGWTSWSSKKIIARFSMRYLWPQKWPLVSVSAAFELKKLIYAIRFVAMLKKEFD